jgi:hypothetical protein
VKRADAVFLAGLSARLVHDIMQVLFAINETCYVGDGANIEFAARLPPKPDRFAERARAALYPPTGDGVFEQQREMLIGLIDDTEHLAPE